MDQAVKAENLRVVLADDHQMVREALAPFIQRVARHVEVLHAGSLSEAREKAELYAPIDLIILDLLMPGMKGLTGLREMRARFPQTPIVILSGNDHPDDVAESIQIGASGFIPKTMVGAALVDALKRVLAGERFVPAPRGTGGEQGGGRGSDVIAQLTARQRAVLSELVEGYSNKQIAKRLGIEEITVKVHLQRIFKRLSVTNRTQAVRRAMEMMAKHRRVGSTWDA